MADCSRGCPESRQALRYIIRNTTLPPRVRAEAQLQLTQMHCYTNPTQIRNRCILGGKGRGVFSDFKMSRVSTQAVTLIRGRRSDVEGGGDVLLTAVGILQYNFRMQAIAGSLPGVQKASW